MVADPAIHPYEKQQMLLADTRLDSPTLINVKAHFLEQISHQLSNLIESERNKIAEVSKEHETVLTRLSESLQFNRKKLSDLEINMDSIQKEHLTMRTSMAKMVRDSDVTSDAAAMAYARANLKYDKYYLFLSEAPGLRLQLTTALQSDLKEVADYFRKHRLVDMSISNYRAFANPNCPIESRVTDALMTIEKLLWPNKRP